MFVSFCFPFSLICSFHWKRIICMHLIQYVLEQDEVDNSKEKAKLQMRLRGTQAKLDAFRNRYMEAMKESDLMNKNFEEAAGKLKDQLASKGIEVLNLKKKLVSTIGQWREIIEKWFPKLLYARILLVEIMIIVHVYIRILCKYMFWCWEIDK